MKYIVTQIGRTLYDGDDFREAFSMWSKSAGEAKINVPIRKLPKYMVGDEFRDKSGRVWRVEDYEFQLTKNGQNTTYYVADYKGNREKFKQSDIVSFKGGGIVSDYQRIKEGLIFKNEYLASIVEKFLFDVPEFWFERVGKIIYVQNKSYLDTVSLKAEQILSKIEGTTDYVSKMINDKPIKMFTFEVDYDRGGEEIQVMAFSVAEAERIVSSRVSEKTNISGKKLKKIKILAVQ
tara:strand:+ start:91 stop:795 length:705 start_codon:yes stop_codon:yes gene_type:complete